MNGVRDLGLKIKESLEICVLGKRYDACGRNCYKLVRIATFEILK